MSNRFELGMPSIAEMMEVLRGGGSGCMAEWEEGGVRSSDSATDTRLTPDIEFSVTTQSLHLPGVRVTPPSQTTSNGKLVQFLKDEHSVPGPLRTELRHMKSEVGEGMMRRVAEAGRGVGVYRLARKVAGYCEMSDVVACLKWLLEFSQEAEVRKCLEWRAMRLRVRDAVLGRRPL